MTESWHEYAEREAEEARLAEMQERSERFLPAEWIAQKVESEETES